MDTWEGELEDLRACVTDVTPVGTYPLEGVVSRLLVETR